MTALRLFARDGYEAVSVSDIAGELGMTKGALYKHYKNKRDIFDRIIERIYQIDAEHAKKHDVPEVTFDQSPSSYRNVTMNEIKSFIISQFRFCTEDEFGCDFRKMLILEQYRNPEMADLYQKTLVGGPISYMEDLFREMMTQGLLKNSNPRLLALDFYAPFYLLVSMADAPSDGEKGIDLLMAHVENFIQKNTPKNKSSKR